MEMGKEKELTLEYYNKNAVAFVKDTVVVDFQSVQDLFLMFVPVAGRVLDFGCGSGRDSKYFLSKGYDVTAIDGSKELAQLAGEYIGQKVINISFQDFREEDAYDGVWACASLLHLPKTELKQVIKNIWKCLHRDGVLYASFKYGDFAGMRKGRYFTNLTEEGWQAVISGIGFETIKMWVTADVREGRFDEQWLNVIVKKI